MEDLHEEFFYNLTALTEYFMPLKYFPSVESRLPKISLERFQWVRPLYFIISSKHFVQVFFHSRNRQAKFLHTKGPNPLKLHCRKKLCQTRKKIPLRLQFNKMVSFACKYYPYICNEQIKKNWFLFYLRSPHYLFLLANFSWFPQTFIGKFCAWRKENWTVQKGSRHIPESG